MTQKPESAMDAIDRETNDVEQVTRRGCQCGRVRGRLWQINELGRR